MSEYAASMSVLSAGPGGRSRSQLDMAHELTGALQQTGRVGQRRPVKEPHVHVRSKYVDVREGRISQACNRTAVMHEFADLIPAFSHHVKPVTCDGSQFAWMFFHPGIDGGIVLDSPVESQQFPFIVTPFFGFRDSC